MAKNTRKLVVVGNAPGFEQELVDFYAQDMFVEYDVCAINASALRVCDFKYFASYHPEYISAVQRDIKIPRSLYKVVCHKNCSEGAGVQVDILIRHEPPSGSSTLLGVLMGVQEGYSMIRIIGAPLEDAEYVQYQEGWEAAWERGKFVTLERLSSSRGWTKRFCEEKGLC